MVRVTVAAFGEVIRQQRFEQGEVKIGRSSGNDLILTAAFVSRYHCKLVLQNGRVAVVDLGSTAGTFVGRDRISGERTLSPGEQVHIRPYTLTIEVEGAEVLDTRAPAMPEWAEEQGRGSAITGTVEALRADRISVLEAELKAVREELGQLRAEHLALLRRVKAIERGDPGAGTDQPFPSG